MSACPANINLSWLWHEKSPLEWGVRPPPSLGSLPPAALVFVFVAKSPRPPRNKATEFFVLFGLVLF